MARDIEVIAELRATVMRADLERLGRYDEHRVRQRLRDSFSTQHRSIIMIDGELAWCVTVRPSEGRQWLEHFYLLRTDKAEVSDLLSCAWCWSGLTRKA